MVNWLIEDGPWESDRINEIAKEIVRQGMKYEIIKYKPFGATELNQFSDDACVVTLGSINLVRQVQRTKRWYPGSIANFDNFKCSTYYAHYGQYLLNDDYLMMPLAEITRRWRELQEHFSKEELFVRPDSGTKTFTGQTSTTGNFKDFGKPETLCVVAAAKQLGREYRIFVCKNGGIIAGSMYRNKSAEINYCDVYKSLPEDNEHASEVLGLCSYIYQNVKWQPDRIFAFDIGYDTNEDRYAILELTAYSCAGWYASDIPSMIKYGAEAALEDWKEQHG